MANLDTLATLIREFGRAFEPLTAAFESQAALRDFLEVLGWDFDIATIPNGLGPASDVKAQSENVSAIVDGGDLDADAISSSLLPAIRTAISAISNLNDPSAPDTTPEFQRSFPRELIDYLIVKQLLKQQGRWGYLLLLLRLIRLEDIAETTTRPAHVRHVFAIDDLGGFFSNPLSYVESNQTGYSWGQTDFAGELLIQNLFGFLDAWGLNVREVQVDEQTLAMLRKDALSTDSTFDLSLELPFVESVNRQHLYSAGAGLFLLPETTTGLLPGFALLPYATAGFEETVTVTDNLTLSFQGSGDLTGGFGLLMRPEKKVDAFSGLASGTPSAVSSEFRAILKLTQPSAPILILGNPDATRLQCGGVSTEAGSRYHSASGFEVFTEFGVEGGKLVIKPKSGEKDSFLSELLPDKGIEIDFDLGVGFSTKKGVYFRGSGGFEVPLASHVKVGPIEIVSATLGVHFKDSGMPVELLATLKGDFSILKATVQDVGLLADFKFPSERNGNLGPVDLALRFRPPNGVGIVVDSGPVSGGGFLSFDRDLGRYAGAIELKVFSISVKAFGLLDTKMPDGKPGYSFVIVIVAEFTPIQLGFGFTLIGVGGLLGINRSVSSDALSAAVRTGSLEHVLFPHDVVANAPAIINDLASIFPAALGHYIFGPMGKLGWGTPTLITAELGILLEFPGPRLGLIGVLHMQLPKPDAALLSLQMAVAGLLDFPAKQCSVDASIYDSNVVGMPITGDMAFRISYGSKPTFLLSVGGFNPGFKAPPAFPKLNPCAVDLGVHGNPSLVASGYFALTSNSAQIGAGMDLRAHGAGIDLHGWLTYDALFIFSPFSFSAGISAGVRVSFHGVGLGVSLGGTLSGPSPWHFAGKACVSVLWWDACLPIDITFGSKTPAAVQEVDPWFGTGEGTDSRVEVIGLQSAVGDTRNWSGSAPPEGYTVVSLATGASEANPPIDPLGPATLHQTVCPLNKTLEKFGEYKPTGHTRFDFTSAKVNGGEKITKVDYVKDQFVPGHFLNLPNDKKLSRDSYEEMTSGITLAPNAVTLGSTGHRTLDYETALINDAGERTQLDGPFPVTELELQAILGRCASALGGIRRSGNNKYMLPGRPKLVTFTQQKYVVADPCTRGVNLSITPTPLPRTEAEQALLDWEANTQNAAKVGRYVVLPKAA